MLLAEAFLDEVLGTLLGTGGDYADVFVERSLTTTLERREGATGDPVFREDLGVGLRIVSGSRVEHRSVEGLDEGHIRGVARDMAAAFGMAPRCTVAPLAVFPPRHLNQSLIPPGLVPLEWKAALLSGGEAAAFAADPRVRSHGALYSEVHGTFLVANSQGLLAEESRSSLTLYQEVAVEHGGRHFKGTHTWGGPAAGVMGADAEGPKAAAREAVRVAVSRAEAIPAPAGLMTVVFGPRAAGLLIHETVGHALEGDFAASGRSPFSGRVGQRVAPPGFTLLDDGAMAGRRGTADVDDEGTPTRRAVLIEDGVLAGYLTDRLSGPALGMTLSGHARRASYRDPPLPRMRNTCVLPGKHTPHDLLSSVDFGLYVGQMGRGRVTIPDGAFTFEVAEAYLIRDGRPAEPVRGVRLSGRGPDVLMGLDGLGSEVALSPGVCIKEGQAVPVCDSAPALRVPRLLVEGDGVC